MFSFFRDVSLIHLSALGHDYSDFEQFKTANKMCFGDSASRKRVLKKLSVLSVSSVRCAMTINTVNQISVCGSSMQVVGRGCGVLL